MTPAYVERLLTQDARLLARRDSTRELPCIDWSIEDRRQKALELFFAWQDGMAQFEDLIPVCMFLKVKVDLNRALIKWEQEYGLED
jgi:hypothetical protein